MKKRKKNENKEVDATERWKTDKRRSKMKNRKTIRKKNEWKKQESWKWKIWWEWGRMKKLKKEIRWWRKRRNEKDNEKDSEGMNYK